ncbi:hypothetical protein ONE63_005285 [Megalurothrips usitatus]|uniref:39S ribosomal protein L41, mitochondrial n=1 Tax=Megalurothrips usitatus TaxID=439358 RepID=A0AAV7XZV6_9NEOP|nr:hypothetical protein ONE63_005285 [Megalurothrips usitatus]
MAAVLKVTSSSVLSKISRAFFQPVRGKRRDHPNKRPHVYEFLNGKELYPEAPRVQTGKLKYYPRDPDYQDPPYEPTKLLMVERVKPMKGQPHWDRKVLTRLGLDSMMRPWVALLLVLFALNVILTQAIDTNHDGVDDGPDEDGDGVVDSAGLMSPSLPLLLLSVLPAFALRLFGAV